jgi:hypothetical protein
VVDYQSGSDATAPLEPIDGESPKPGFLNTTTGKLVVGGIALVLVLGAVGAAVFYFFISGAVERSVQSNTTTTTSASSTGTPEAIRTPENPVERSLASTFTFRNVFAPTVKRTYEAADTSGSASTDSSNTGASVDVPSNTLFLQSIISENGEPKAVFIWNGQTYTVGEGEQVAESPWKVIQINSDSVLMLYGDSQVTLSVGQGVGK